MGCPQICATTKLTCPFATGGPKPIKPLPKKIKTKSNDTANIKDKIPFAVIPSFGNCISMKNPITAAQTAAAMGSLTPGMCIPIATWMGFIPKTLCDGQPTLNITSKAQCSFGGGVIMVAGPAQTTVNV